MTAAFLLLAAIGLVWCGVGAVQSRAIRAGADFYLFTLVGLVITTGAAAAVLVDWPALLAGRTEQLPQLALIMAGAGIASVAGFLCMWLAMQSGEKAIVWALAQSAMVVPYAAGVLGYDDRCTAASLAGLLAMLGGIALLAWSGGTERAAGASRGRWLLLVAGAFALIGFSQFLAGLPSRWPGWQDAAGLRVPLQQGAAVLVLLAAAAVRRRPVRRVEVGLGALSALFILAGQAMLFACLDRCAGLGVVAAVYPLATGCCILAFALYGALLLGERPGRRAIAGHLLLLAGIAGLAAG